MKKVWTAPVVTKASAKATTKGFSPGPAEDGGFAAS